MKYKFEIIRDKPITKVYDCPFYYPDVDDFGVAYWCGALDQYAICESDEFPSSCPFIKLFQKKS